MFVYQALLQFPLISTSKLTCSYVALPLYGDAAILVNTATYPELADVDLTGRKSYCIQKLSEVTPL